jgi:hypothetical protein
MTKHTDTMPGAWPFHDKTHWYYVWGLTISWQNTLIVCLGFDNFMRKHTATMSRPWHFIKKQTDTMSGASSFHDETHWYYVWGMTISWQNTLILCLGLDHFMTNQTDTMSEVWPFHDKTHWYYVKGLTISWQNTLILCLGLDYFITKHTDTMFGASTFHNKTHWYYSTVRDIAW